MWLKQCGTCGIEYDAYSWERLPVVGVMHVDRDEEGPAEAIELRNCPCGSTLGVSTTEDDVGRGGISQQASG